jgi:hypothetical protein
MVIYQINQMNVDARVLDFSNDNIRFSDIYSKPEISIVCVLLILYNLLKISIESKYL